MTHKLGAYEILHELSSGGMGSVLLGRRRGPGAFEQLVAIKTIKPEYARAAHVRAMFLDEAAILARLTHPGIATVHDFGDEDGALYMVMEYVAGNSFRSLIDGPMPPAVAARAVVEACRGLHAAHEVRDTSGALLGVVHRDISPDNLMLGFDGHVKVIDFGIALVKNRQAPVTEFGTVKGKPPYMSPEQIKNEPIDRRSDIFSLGVVLYEMLTGRALFDGDSIYAIARAVEHQPIAPPSAVTNTSMPAGLDAVVMRALDRDLTKRTPTAARFAEELERVIGAAGDETLESWAERELASAREAHRQWIAGVVAGRDAPKPKVGRATGAVTAIGAEALAALDVQPVDSQSDGRRNVELAETALPPSIDDIEEPPLRRSPVVPIIGLLVIVAAIVVVIAMMRRSSSLAVDAGDALADALEPVIDAEILASVDASEDRIDAAVSIDAPPTPVDAGPRAPVDARTPVEAPRTPVDARVTELHADAPTVQATATGTVDFVNPPKGSSVKYVTIVLDGRNIGTTPIMRREIPAGHHTVEYVGVDRTEKAEFDLAPGKHVRLTPPMQ